MKRILVVIFLNLIVLPVLQAGFQVTCAAADPLRIDVLYMNHGPMQPTLEQMRATFSRFDEKIQVAWHDFESQEGETFMAKKGIKSHVPLQIWFNGKDTLTIADKTVRFFGFPTGAGPGFFQGQWSLKDLDKAIEALTTEK
jgi:hypothetical protein